MNGDRDYPESELIESHLPCPDCGSSDALATYSDGHSFCYSCEKHTRGSGEESIQRPSRRAQNNAPVSEYKVTSDASSDLISAGEYREIRRRHITKETCRKFGVKTFLDANENPFLVFPYMNEGQVSGQKIKGIHKNFYVRGKIRGLFGEHLFKAGGGDRLCITEGELDCMSLYQCLLTGSETKRRDRPVVSIPNGAAAAKKAIQESYEFISKYDMIILMFDQDEQGQKAAFEVAKILPPGRVYIANLPLKDASDMLVAGRKDELTQAYWNAKEYRPKGIVDANSEELWEEIQNETEVESTPYPWPSVNKLTLGLRKRELVTITSGTGMGKSTFTRELAHHLQSIGKKVGMIMLEENMSTTVRSLMGIELCKPLNVDRKAASMEEQRAAFEKVTENVSLYEGFGGMSLAQMEEAIRYLATAKECDFIIFDHISIAIAALGEGNERQQIDNIVTRLRSVVDETKVGLIMVSHLSRTDKKPHEEGGQISLSNLRGSHSIPQISDVVIGLERNQQCVVNPNIVDVRILKNRFAPMTGITGSLLFRPWEGRLRCVETFDGFTEEELLILPPKEQEKKPTTGAPKNAPNFEDVLNDDDEHDY